MVTQPAARTEARAGQLQPELIVWLGVIAASWVAAYWLEASGTAHLLHHHTIYHSGQILAGGIALLGVWQVMTVAMMLPGTLPAVLRLSEASSRLAFVYTYGLVWTGFALVAFAADMGLHALVHGWPAAAQHEDLIPAAILGVAAAYQLSPWKRASLAACRMPGPTRAGPIAYSSHCLGSGWALMLIMFSAGVANLAWMVALALAMMAEKTLPSSDGPRYAVAAVLGLLAAASLVGAPLL